MSIEISRNTRSITQGFRGVKNIYLDTSTYLDAKATIWGYPDSPQRLYR